MERRSLLKVPVASVLLLGLTSFMLAFGDDRRQLQDTFMRSCDKNTRREEGVGRHFCRDAYHMFLYAFEGLDPRSMQRDRSPAYFRHYFLTPLFPEAVTDNGLFWSKTFNFHYKLLSSQVPIVGLGSTQPAKVVDDMKLIFGIRNWCSDFNSNIYVNNNCRTNHVKEIFWCEGSKLMAERMVGNFFYLTRDGHFDRASDFNRCELRILLKNESLTTAITVLNIVPWGSRRDCSSGRLRELKRTTEPRLIYECYDVYGDPDRPRRNLFECIDHIVQAKLSGKYVHRHTSVPCMQAHTPIYNKCTRPYNGKRTLLTHSRACQVYNV